ncbi:MAG: PAS domain-containing protein [Planctomycetota bacterium]|jgi:PAS domain S-box-containing protein
MKENGDKTRRFSERHTQAVEALKRSEERYALAQRAANIGSWDWDIGTGELVWSEQIEPMFGFGRGEFGVTYEAFLGCVHPEDRQHVVDSVNACIEQGKDYAIEHRIVWPDGTVRWISETGDVIRDENGKAIRMVGIVQDITERKNVEIRQRLAGRILESLSREVAGLEAIRDVVALVKEFSGFKAVGIRLHEGDDFPYFETKGFSEGFVQAENYLCVRDKNGKQIYDSQGNRVLECMCGNVLSGRTDPTFPFFTEGGSFWTNSTTKLLTCTRPEDLQVPVRSHCNKAGYESVALIPLRSGDQVVGLLQLNDTRPGRFTTEMIRFLEEIGASIGIALARIRAEEDVKNIAKFPSENPNPVLRVTKDGVLLYANAASGPLLTEWGCKVGQIVPYKWCQTVSEVFLSGAGKRIEIEHGDRIFSFMVAPVIEANYVNLYGRDITERKQAEEDLRKHRQHLEELVQARTAELTEANRKLLQEIEERKRLEKDILNISEQEQQRIGRELHDSIGQQFTGIAFMMKVLEQRLASKFSDEATDAAEITKLVKQAMDQTRWLAKGLHPVDLDAGSLMPALQEFAATTEHLFGICCTFKCDKPIPIDDAAVAVHLYRIAQEAVTNAIKHGGAKNIQIELAYDGDNSVLVVRSDGLDFPMRFEKRGTGIGLQIMDHRVDIIGGSLDIHKASEGGTIVTCTFPNKRQ